VVFHASHGWECSGGLARRCACAGLDVHVHVLVEQTRSAAREEARLQHEELQGAMKKDVVRLEEALAWAKAVAQVCVCVCMYVCVCARLSDVCCARMYRVAAKHAHVKS
jgi:hypothetical protein